MAPGSSPCLQDAAWVQALLSLVEAAGREILRVYDEAGRRVEAAQAQQKSDGSPVTQADLAAHRLLATGLAALAPHVPMVSEEDGASWGRRESHGVYWLIDPLDGTREFLSRNGEFTVNVALIEQGRPVFGVVGQPVAGTLYWGGPGMGAWCSESGRKVRPLDAARASSNEAQALESQVLENQALRVMASRSHLDAHTQTLLDLVSQHRPIDLVQAGSSLKFCHLAANLADFYPRLGPTQEWDTAAAQAVLEGAGGAVLDAQGHALVYGKPQTLNPWFIAVRDVSMIDMLLPAFASIQPQRP